MTVTIVGVTHANSGVNSQASVGCSPPAGALVGDLALFVCSNDRGSVAPVVSAATAGYTTGYAIASSNIAAEMGWKRLTAGDLGQDITASYSTARRAACGMVVLRGAADPVFTNRVLASSPSTHTGPAATPAVANSMLIALNALALVNAPFSRTFTASGTGWTEDAEDVSSNAGTNAVIEIAHRLISGGAGASQAGVTLTPSDTSSALVSYASTVAVAPAVNAAPSASVTGIQNVAPGATFAIDTSAVDADGSIASYNLEYVYPTSGGPTLTGATTSHATGVAGAAGSLYVFKQTVTDDDGTPSAPVYTEVRVPITSGEIVPLPGYPPVGVAVTNSGGAASEGAALGDGSDTTVVVFPGATSTQVERVYRLQPTVARQSGTKTTRESQDVAGTLVAKTRLYQAADWTGATRTQKAEWTDTTTTSAADQAGSLTGTQAGTISDWGALWVGFLENV